MNNKNKSIQVVALLTVAVLTLGTMPFAAAGDDSKVKLEGDFTGVDDGNAKFESRDDGAREKLSVEITDVNLADGVYDVSIDGTSIASATATGGIIDLNIDTQCDDTQPGDECEQGITDLPDLVGGEIVTVSNGTDEFTATLE